MDFNMVMAGGSPVNVAFERRWIHLKNDGVLTNALAGRPLASLWIAMALKNLYRTKIGQELQIGELSIAVEILGHVFPQKLADAIDYLRQGTLEGAGGLPLLSGNLWQPVANSALKYLLAQLIHHTSVIDIGESSVDNNRWLWDAIAGKFHALARAPTFGTLP